MRYLLAGSPAVVYKRYFAVLINATYWIIVIWTVTMTETIFELYVMVSGMFNGNLS